MLVLLIGRMIHEVQRAASQSLDRIAWFHLWGIHRHRGEVGWYDRRGRVGGLGVMKRRGRGRDTLGGGKTELLLNLLDQGTL